MWLLRQGMRCEVFLSLLFTDAVVSGDKGGEGRMGNESQKTHIPFRIHRLNGPG